MKKSVAAVLLLLVFAMSACGDSVTGDIPAPSADPAAESSAEMSPTPVETAQVVTEAGAAVIIYEETAYSETLTLSPTLSLQATAHYPLTGVAEIDGYYADVLESFKQSAAAIANEYRDDTYEGTYVIDEDYEVVLNNGYLFSVHRVAFDFFGGAHPNHNDKCETFSTSGRQLSLDDMFTVPRDEYLPRLLEIIEEFVDSADADRYMFDPNVMDKIRENFPFDTFCATEPEDGIYLQFYFSPYKIAPYAAGTIIIPITREAVADILVNYE